MIKFKLKEENIEVRRKKYFLLKHAFTKLDKNIMRSDYTCMISALLDAERETYFKEENGGNNSFFDTIKRVKDRFIRNFSCCGCTFTDFDCYVKHTYEFHDNRSEDLKNEIDKDVLYHAHKSNNLSFDIKKNESADFYSNQEMKKKYPCLIKDCYKSYKNLNGLKYHMIHHHNNEEEDL
ncbi:hypothetical protein CWI38_1243p0020 [Hamiltosporidium tvaerminnensis]|uniref:C2H2-type domain-containing protein n=2 Tax=Hamiltosporidium TaxID=1176354 RepID=A0A4Q9LPD9_9MICR|nr:hypothetical protein CWI39_0078p0030 [Hamiltosporidium magnivora]TBU11371.1 hypothetical protein CWI38_1243p0020 [Hamiltosporidium tvaerminnensis]